MGILNVTPDSFSDGGLFRSVDEAVKQARRMIAEGAAIIDVGGESTRPGAQPVAASEEQDRVLPVIEALAPMGCLLSIDSYRAETVRLAVRAGAHIINDVWGLQREPVLAEIAAATGAGLVIMHTGRERAKLPDPIEDQLFFLTRSLELASRAGIRPEQIVLDPGFGFAKENVEENVALITRFSELATLHYPLMAGVSRKRFLGTLTGREAPHRDAATAAANALLRLQGACLFRVHAVEENRDALQVADAVLAATRAHAEA